jgi:hypothetical protein
LKIGNTSSEKLVTGVRDFLATFCPAVGSIIPIEATTVTASAIIANCKDFIVRSLFGLFRRQPKQDHHLRQFHF